MGTQAELDHLKHKRWVKCGEYNKVAMEYDDLVEAQSNMRALKSDFSDYRKQIKNTIKTYNDDGNEWKGNAYDEIESTLESLDYVIEKFDGTKDDLDNLVSEYYIKKMDIQTEINDLSYRIDHFDLDEEKEEV